MVLALTSWPQCSAARYRSFLLSPDTGGRGVHRLAESRDASPLTPIPAANLTLCRFGLACPSRLPARLERVERGLEAPRLAARPALGEWLAVPRRDVGLMDGDGAGEGCAEPAPGAAMASFSTVAADVMKALTSATHLPSCTRWEGEGVDGCLHACRYFPGRQGARPGDN